MKKKKARSKTHKKSASSSNAGKSVKSFFGKHKHFQQTLVKKREEFLHTVKQKEEDITQGEIGDEADAANQTFEREMMFEMTHGERIILEDVEAALRKIEKGGFGMCESCHKRITSERLHAMPWARCCIACQTRTESSSKA